MNFAAQDYYRQPPRPRLVPGAIFLNVPVPFMSPHRLPAIVLLPDGTYRHQGFLEAWAGAREVLRDEGIPVLLRAKARPVLVLRIGAAMTDAMYRQTVWVAPLYSQSAPTRHGPNIFPLPAWARMGLRFEGFVDLYQATTVPQQYFGEDNYSCELTPTALSLLLGAMAAWAEADPHAGAGHAPPPARLA